MLFRSSPEKLREALNLGASGIQVGTAFAFCEESGETNIIKEEIISKWGRGLNKEEHLFTDPLASPTGFPFKVVHISNSLSEKHCYEQRERICDVGYLREIARDKNGGIIYRCPAENIQDYIRKGGNIKNTDKRKCLCNALLSSVGLAQIQKNNYLELPLVTAGNDLENLSRWISPSRKSYSAKDVIHSLLEITEPISKQHQKGNFLFQEVESPI